MLSALGYAGRMTLLACSGGGWVGYLCLCSAIARIPCVISVLQFSGKSGVVSHENVVSSAELREERWLEGA